jgi:hypothetical protein
MTVAGTLRCRLRLTEAGVEHCRSHVPQDELLVAAKRLGVTVEVCGREWAALVGGSPASLRLSARSPWHLLEQLERLFPATSGKRGPL